MHSALAWLSSTDNALRLIPIVLQPQFAESLFTEDSLLSLPTHPLVIPQLSPVPGHCGLSCHGHVYESLCG